MIKSTDKNIAKFFKTTPQTLSNWKRDGGLIHRYNALKEYFIRIHQFEIGKCDKLEAKND